MPTLAKLRYKWSALRLRVLGVDGYRHTGERVCPEVANENFKNHLRVYRFVTQYVQEKRVLDVGCGTGYGSHQLASHGAASVTGIDYSEEALDYARRRYTADTLAFRQMDAQALDFADDTFDVVVSSENLEHLPDAEASVREMRRVLVPGGLLVLATPNKEMESPDTERSPNPFHVKEFSYGELDGLLRRHFESVSIFENMLESAHPSGRRQKAERRDRGEIGIEWQGRDSLDLDGLPVELDELHNTHSFLALAR